MERFSPRVLAPLPDSYLACVLDGPKAPWRLERVPLRLPSTHEILIKVECCGLCHTDLSTQAGELGPMVQWPTIPGHEIVGTIVALGSNVTQFVVGDRAGGTWHGGHDGLCRQCHQGFPQGCKNQIINGVSKSGGLGEYCILREEAVVRVPHDAKATDVAPLLCAGVTLFNSLRHHGVKPGETVVIQGVGGLGHLGIQYARKMGFRVVVLSRTSSKQADAKELGAHHFICSESADVATELNKLGGAKLIIVTAPNSNVEQYTKCLQWQGKIIILASINNMHLDATQLLRTSSSICGWHAGSPTDCEETIEVSRLYDLKAMTECFPLSRIQEAVDHLTKGLARYRVVVTMEKTDPDHD
uniref:Enoyl reductase (ER) domain-containing protein n=1 Tax=Bionectria ochroleuca TaxID=29856 RepID=A0A0B7JVM6_BIOOC